MLNEGLNHFSQEAGVSLERNRNIFRGFEMTINWWKGCWLGLDRAILWASTVIFALTSWSPSLGFILINECSSCSVILSPLLSHLIRMTQTALYFTFKHWICIFAGVQTAGLWVRHQPLSLLWLSRCIWSVLTSEINYIRVNPWCSLLKRYITTKNTWEKLAAGGEMGCKMILLLINVSVAVLESKTCFSKTGQSI